MSAPVVPKGSIVFISGVNGYIASHIADQFLAQGYAVRGSARDETKVTQIKDMLLSRHPDGKFEGVVLETFDDEGKLHSALKGVSALVHAAADVSFSADPHKVTKWSTDSMNSFLSAASKTPTLKRVVITSSSAAACTAIPDTYYKVTEQSWNDKAWKAAFELPDDEPTKPFVVYSAGKYASEKAAWKFMAEHKPPFTLSAVLPNLNIGPILGSFQSGSTAGWVKNLYYEASKDGLETFRNLPPQWYIDVRDDALLHVAATLEEDAKDRRIMGFAGPAGYADYVDSLKKQTDKKEYPAPAPGAEGKDISEVDNGYAVELLKRYGQQGWRSLDESTKDQMEFKSYEAK